MNTAQDKMNIKDAVGQRIKVGDIVAHIQFKMHGSGPHGLFIQKGQVVCFRSGSVGLYKKDATRTSYVGADKIIVLKGGKL